MQYWAINNTLYFFAPIKTIKLLYLIKFIGYFTKYIIQIFHLKIIIFIKLVLQISKLNLGGGK